MDLGNKGKLSFVFLTWIKSDTCICFAFVSVYVNYGKLVVNLPLGSVWISCLCICKNVLICL